MPTKEYAKQIHISAYKIFNILFFMADWEWRISRRKKFK